MTVRTGSRKRRSPMPICRHARRVPSKIMITAMLAAGFLAVASLPAAAAVAPTAASTSLGSVSARGSELNEALLARGRSSSSRPIGPCPGSRTPGGATERTTRSRRPGNDPLPYAATRVFPRKLAAKNSGSPGVETGPATAAGDSGDVCTSPRYLRHPEASSRQRSYPSSADNGGCRAFAILQGAS